MTRFSEATTHLRTRLRDVKAETAEIVRAGSVIATGSIVQINLDRFARTHEEFILESGDAGFLVGADVLVQEPADGDQIRIGSQVWIVKERDDLGIRWQWHDTARTTRVIFCKEWN